MFDRKLLTQHFGKYCLPEASEGKDFSKEVNIYQYLLQNGCSTSKDISKALGITYKYVRTLLPRLIKKNKVVAYRHKNHKIYCAANKHDKQDIFDDETCIKYINEQGCVSSKQIENKFDVSQATVWQKLRKLEEKGLIFKPEQGIYCSSTLSTSKIADNLIQVKKHRRQRASTASRRTRSRKVDPRIEKARELYQQGITVAEISRRLPAATKTIRKWVEGLSPPKKPRIEVVEARSQARELYLQGVGVAKISRFFRRSPITIHKWIEGLELPEDPRIEQAREFYQQGASIREISRRLQASYKTINKWIADLKPDVDPRIEQAREFYQKGITVAEITRLLKASKRTINKWIADLEPPKDPKIEQARQLFQQGASIREIERRLGRGHRVINKWIADLELPKDPRIEKARELYQQGVAIKKIARRLRAAPITIKKWISDLIPEITKKEQARNLFRQGMKVTSIADELQVARTTVYRWIRQ